jgi:tetratricopeptide (TPR) repeat protein
MHLASLVEMVESAFDDRVLLGTRDEPVTGADLGRLVRAGASTLAGYDALVYVGENHPLLPVALFASAWAGIPFVPVNYRLEDHQLNALVARQQGGLVLADAATAPRIDPEEAKKLAALGYIGTPKERSGPLPNPRDEIGSLREIKNAFQLAAQRRNDEAIDALRALLLKNPSMDVATRLGEVLLDSGRADEAIAVYEAAMKRAE